MAAHRYWRFYMPQFCSPSGNATILQAYTLELFDAAGTSLCQTAGGTPRASSAHASFPVANAFNPVNTDCWQNATGSAYPHWIGWDFGAANERDVTRFRFASNTTTNNPVNSWVEYSDDDTNWTKLFYFPHFESGVSYVRDYSFAAPSPQIGYQLAGAVGAVQIVGSLDWANSRQFSPDSPPSLNKRGLWWEGDGRIASTVMADTNGDGTGDINLHREVLLIDDQSLVVVKIAWSDAVTGAYSFDYIRRGIGVTYTVYAIDYENNYRAVIADRLTPEAMP